MPHDESRANQNTTSTVESDQSLALADEGVVVDGVEDDSPTETSSTTAAPTTTTTALSTTTTPAAEVNLTQFNLYRHRRPFLS